jgi:hypothetical protein
MTYSYAVIGGMFMRDRDEPYQEDPMAVGRGIFYGLLFGSILWSIILGSIWFYFSGV